MVYGQGLLALQMLNSSFQTQISLLNQKWDWMCRLYSQTMAPKESLQTKCVWWRCFVSELIEIKYKIRELIEIKYRIRELIEIKYVSLQLRVQNDKMAFPA